jgi:hypothetical protein
MSDIDDELRRLGIPSACLYEFRYWQIPNLSGRALDRYIALGIEPGAFLSALLCNDLLGALEHGDEYNLSNLPAYGAYLYNHAPRSCYGSKQKVVLWVEEQKKRRAAELARAIASE